MNKFIVAVGAVLLSTAGLSQARDIGVDEALKLQQAGTIKSFEEMNKAALAKHPGAVIEDTELDEEHGRLIYQVELRDPAGPEWDLEFDATTGELLQDHRDD